MMFIPELQSLGSTSVRDAEEFMKKEERLLWQSGIMELDRLSVCGYSFHMLSRPKFRLKVEKPGEKPQWKLEASYSYFENENWTPLEIEVDPEHSCAWMDSGSIGYDQYAFALIAAYVLRSLETPEGKTNWLWHHSIDGEDTDRAIGYINDVLGEKYEIPYISPWNYYAEHYRKIDGFDERDFRRYVLNSVNEYDEACFRRILDMLTASAVEKGMEKMKKQDGGRFRTSREECMDAVDVLETAEAAVEKVFENIPDNPELAFNLVSTFLEILDFHGKRSPEEMKQTLEVYHQADGLYSIETAGDIIDPLGYPVPAFSLWKASQLAGKDFWKEYEKRGWISGFMDSRYKSKTNPEPKKPERISRDEYFKVDEEYLLPFWGKDEWFPFSESMESWFNRIRMRYCRILENERFDSVKDPVEWICRIAQKGEQMAKGCCPFSDFVLDSFDQRKNPKWLAWWKLYEDLIDEKIAGTTEAEPKQEQLDPEVRRPGEMRKYLAVLGNKELREYVFGINGKRLSEESVG